MIFSQFHRLERKYLQPGFNYGTKHYSQTSCERTAWFNYRTEHYSQTPCEWTAWFNYGRKHYSQTPCEWTAWFNYRALIVVDLHKKILDACPPPPHNPLGPIFFFFLQVSGKFGKIISDSNIARRNISIAAKIAFVMENKITDEPVLNAIITCDNRAYC